MYSYPVTIWYRCNGANQKDYLSMTLIAKSEKEAEEQAYRVRSGVYKVEFDRPEIIKLQKLRTLKMLILDYQKEREKLTQNNWGAVGFPDNDNRDLELQNKIKETEREFDKTLFSYDNI